MTLLGKYTEYEYIYTHTMEVNTQHRLSSPNGNNQYVRGSYTKAIMAIIYVLRST